MNVQYRPPEAGMIPSATRINNESVYAELMRQTADLSAVYVTVGQVDSWHVWVAWATDEMGAKEFQRIIPVSDDGESPMDFISYADALHVAIGMAS